MGPLFVIIFWVIILIPIGFIAGLLFSYIGIPFYYRFRGISEENQKFKKHITKLGLSILFTLVFVPSLCIFGIYLMEKDTNDYWKSKGAWDFWRMPLEEPYELKMIDTMDSASINIWKESSSIVWDITKYEKRGFLIYGETSEVRPAVESKPAGYFLMNLKDGSVKKYTTVEDLKKDLSLLGIDNITLKTIRENWDNYWKNSGKDSR